MQDTHSILLILVARKNSRLIYCSAPEVVAVCVLLYPIDSYLSTIAVSTIVFEIKISFVTLESVEVDKTCDNRDHMRYATRPFSLYGFVGGRQYCNLGIRAAIRIGLPKRSEINLVPYQP